MRINRKVDLAKPALNIAIIYVMVAAIWIVASDQFVLMLDMDPKQITVLQTYKGWLFVVGSGVLIYLLMKKAINDLQKSESMIVEQAVTKNRFLDQFPLPVWQLDTSGKHVYSNSKWGEFSGFSLNGDQVFPWIDIVHENDKPNTIRRFSEGLIGKKSFSFECRLRNREGKYVWVLHSCMPLVSPQGEFDGVTAFLIDIHERRDLIDQYRNSSKKYGYLFKNNPGAMFVFNADDLRILEVNDAAKNLYGYREEEFLTLTVSDLFLADDLPRLKSQLSFTGRQGYQRGDGWKQLKKDGAHFDAELYILKLADNTSQTHVGMVNETTWQRAALTAAVNVDKRFRTIFDHAAVGEIILSESFQILDINPVGYHMLGMEKESIVRTAIFQFIADDSQQMFDSALQNLSGGITCNGYLNLIHRSGGHFRCEWHLVSFHEADKPFYFFSFRNIEEQYSTQKRLEESQRLISTLISGLPGLAYRCLYDPWWTMLFVSEGVKRLTGYNADEMLGNKALTWNELIHPLDKEQVSQTISLAIKHKAPYEIVYRIVDRDKNVKWVMETGRGVYSEGGSTNYLEGFIMDITGEREARQQVEFQTYFLRRIIDTIPFPMFYKDIEGKYLICNSSFAEFHEKPIEEILGLTVFDLFDQGQASTIHNNEQELYKTRKAQVFETELLFPSGKRINAVFHKNIVYNLENEPIGVVGIYFDITERVRAEQIILDQMRDISKLNSEVEQYFYSVTHDLRSPLVTIKGFLGLLKDDIEEQNQSQIYEDINRIGDATDKMHQLVDGLFHFFKSGKTKDVNQAVNLTQLAHEAKEMLTALVSDHNCQLVIQQDMPVVIGDKVLLREVFQNLIENAVKFTYNTTEPKIFIYTKRSDPENELIVCVEDNGIGVAEEHKEQIFKLFNKLDPAKSGAGIGLALVRKIVETHNGKIWVESMGQNTGSTFCFTLNTDI